MTTISVGTWAVSDRARQLINEVLDSGRISYGTKSKEFERQFAALHGVQHGVISNSGTSALQVALQALKELHSWEDGSEVLVPSLTFVASVNVILHNRLRPVLVDVEPDFYGIDVSKIEDVITPRTRAILPVHLFGQPCDMSGVMEIATRHGLRVVEDSCETVGATLHGRPVGSWGDVGCFSTYVAHHIVTGVGGMSITDNPDLARVMRSLTNHGIDVSELPQGSDYDPSWLSRKFRFSRIGHSFRVTELEAALGLAALEEWPEMLAARQENAEYLIARLMPSLVTKIQLPMTRPNATNSRMMFPVVLRDGSKWPLMAWLQERGIETREMVPLIGQPAYKGMWNPNDYPVAQWVDWGGFYVGCHQDMTVDDLDRIVEGIESYMAHGELNHLVFNQECHQ